MRVRSNRPLPGRRLHRRDVRPRAPGLATPLAVEITPAVIGPQAALTEKTGVSGSSDWTVLEASANAADERCV